MLGSLLALVHAHKQCLTVDKEAIAAYDTKLKEERKRADDQVCLLLDKLLVTIYPLCKDDLKLIFFHLTNLFTFRPCTMLEYFFFISTKQIKPKNMLIEC